MALTHKLYLAITAISVISAENNFGNFLLPWNCGTFCSHLHSQDFPRSLWFYVNANEKWSSSLPTWRIPRENCQLAVGFLFFFFFFNFIEINCQASLFSLFCVMLILCLLHMVKATQCKSDLRDLSRTSFQVEILNHLFTFHYWQ